MALEALMLISSLPLLAIIVGLFMYGFLSGKVSEIGRMLFFAGVLALLFASASKTIALIR
jgi:ABC-type amino acid transport system permease subunit